MSQIKHIQTSIDMATYDHLRHLSEIKKKSLKETIQEAIKEYLKKHEVEIMKDPLFSLVGSFSTQEDDWSERDDWRD